MCAKRWSPWADAVAARVAAMVAESKTINETFEHNGIRGAVREAFVRNFLIPFLPPTIGVGTGELINHLGHRSHQVDVVLYNKGMVAPALINGSDIGLFPWETVIAVIEVKSTLTSESCKDALLNALSVHKVHHDIPQENRCSNGEPIPSDTPSLAPVPYYVFAFRSDIKTLHDPEDLIGIEYARMKTGADCCGTDIKTSAFALAVAESAHSDIKSSLEKLERSDLTSLEPKRPDGQLKLPHLWSRKFPHPVKQD